jgi:predicted house-cleaning noncanonical NTP pyrophosphatase (MazG superfamily)
VASKKPERPSAQKQKGNRDMILRALTDRKYRKMLEEKPTEALGARVSDVNLREVSLVLATVRGLEAQIKAIGDELLCLEGPPCGIA